MVAISSQPDGTAAVEIGPAVHVADALRALRDTDRNSPRVELTVDGIDHKAVLDILFGPQRALSDPASKSALAPYGIPAPLEELCASASRAAVEAGRIGFPVRISLASPDLRVWDHADLAVDMVDNAARVRDTFRQLMGLAKARLSRGSSDTPRARPDAPTMPYLSDVSDRLLGVMVTATSESTALLGVRAWPLPEGRVAMELSFADAHGAASDDRTLLVMPAPTNLVERALRRLAGASLVLGTRTAQRRAHLEAIADVLHRLSAFVHDRRREVSVCELRPLAVLLDGTVEVREACVTVSDAFERMLQAPPMAGNA
jgi:acetyltransferase